MGLLEALNKKIDLNEKASDIITIDNNTGVFKKKYKNEMTGTESCDFETVIRNHAFFVMDKDSFDELAPVGFFVEHDKENNTLIFVNTVYENGWKEKERCVFYWDNGVLSHAGSQNNSLCDGIDICGQAFVYRDKNKELIPYLYQENYNDIAAGFKNACLSFFNGNIIIKTKYNTRQGIITSNMFFKEIMNAIIMGNEVTIGMVKYGDEMVPCESMPKIPGKAYRTIEKYAIKKAIDEGAYNFDSEMYLSCIQRFKKGLIVRQFVVYRIYRYPIEKTTVIPIEVSRTILDEKADYAHMVFSTPIYIDDLHRTVFEDADSIVKDWNFLVGKYINGTPHEAGKHSLMQDINGVFGTKYDVYPEAIPRILCALAYNEQLLKLFKLDYTNNGYFRKLLCQKICMRDSTENMNNVLWEIGTIEDGNTLDEMLNLPEGAAEFLAEKKWYSRMLDPIRKITACKEDLVKQMPLEDFITVAETLCTWFDDAFSKYIRVPNTMYRLMKTYGWESWKEYFNFIKEMETSELVDYIKYLSIASISLDENLKWNLPEKKREKALKAFTKKENISATEYHDIFSEIVTRKIKEQKNLWKQYEFQDDFYAVCCPKTWKNIVNDMKHLGPWLDDEMAYEIAAGRRIYLYLRFKDDWRNRAFSIVIENKTASLYITGGYIHSPSGQLKISLKNYCEEKGLTLTEETPS